LIDVALTPAQLRPAQVAVVVDVLRATSSATQALAVGYRKVVCVESVERAASWRGPGRVLAGERSCVRPPGFDFGNSPAEIRSGDVLVLATTNGTPTIVAAGHHAPQVLLACLFNLAAVVAALQAAGGCAEGDLQIVCSGRGGAVALEDVYLAGRLCAELSGRRTDAARVAESVGRAYRSPLQALNASDGAAALRAVGLGADIDHCAAESRLEVVPRLEATSAGAAIIVDSAARASDLGAAEDRATVSLG
jgi:2-phosphosulfolactate phosphatase